MSPQPEQPQTRSQSGGYLSDPRTVLTDIAFPATELHVRWAIGVVMDKLSSFQIPPDLQFTIEIVLAELLNNVVEHGYPQNVHGDIWLKVSAIDDYIEIVTKDRGIRMPGLKPPHPPKPNLDVCRKDLPEGQFGWFMIHKLCTGVEYRRIGSENQITLKITQ